jgi:hypothetical protein
MEENSIIVTSKVSINPVSFTKYQQIFREKKETEENCFNTSDYKSRPLQFLDNKTIDFELSKSAVKNLRNKINWLYFLADKKIIEPINGKKYEFRIAFITLTLPSLQNIQTNELNKLLVLLLNNMRNKHNLKNYVWRLEFQKNGNAHYHICVDTFISAATWQYHWNKLLNKYGFIDAYSDERKNLTFREYVKKYATNNDTSLITAKNRYRFGKKTNWRAPKTVDVRNAYSSNNVASYLSQYFSKGDKIKNKILKKIEDIEKMNLPNWDKNKMLEECNKDLTTINDRIKKTSAIIEAREKRKSNIRLWYCSNNLSKIENLTIYEDSTENDDLLKLLDNAVLDYTFNDTYFTYSKFDYDKQNNFFKYHFKKILKNHATDLGYYNNSA